MTSQNRRCCSCWCPRLSRCGCTVRPYTVGPAQPGSHPLARPEGTHGADVSVEAVVKVERGHGVKAQRVAHLARVGRVLKSAVLGKVEAVRRHGAARELSREPQAPCLVCIQPGQVAPHLESRGTVRLVPAVVVHRECGRPVEQNVVGRRALKLHTVQRGLVKMEPVGRRGVQRC
eukprot:4968727-Prymnesium_polylepis.2